MRQIAPAVESHADVSTASLADRKPGMQLLIEQHDWAGTSLGAMEAWPLSLKVLVQTMLACRLPMYIAWGPEYTQLYNDAYRPILGDKHPAALGQSAKTTWPEIWDTIGPMWEEVWQGKSYGFDDFKLTIQRYGYPEDCYFNFSYSPVPDDSGSIAGVMVTFAETTQKVLNEQRQAFQLLLADSLRDLADPHDVLVTASRLVGGQLEVNRVGYGEIDHVHSTVKVDQEWTSDDATSLAGRTWPLNDLGTEIIGDLLSGKTVVINNVDTDPRLLPYQESYLHISAKSVLCVPLIKAGKMCAVLYLHEHQPRHWQHEEIRLVQEVAERTWDAVNRARAEQYRTQQADEFLTLTQLMPQQAWMADASGQTVWCNQRVFDYTGIVPDKLKGDSWVSVLHPDDLEPISRKWGACIAAGQEYEAEFRMRNTAGEYRWFISRSQPVRDTGGNIVRWVGTNTDVHQQKQSVTELVRINSTLEEVVAERTADRDRMWLLSTDIMLVAGFDASIVATNPAWHQILGWAEDELIGKNFLDFVHPEDRQGTLEEAGKLASGLKTERFENRYRHKDGSYRWLSWIAVPDASYIHAVARDVTKDKQQAEALRQAESALRQSQKMEAVGQLTGGIAHDFNNLLGSISANLEMLQYRVQQGHTDKLDTYARNALTTVERAASLTHRLLAFSRRQALVPKPINPNRLILSMEDLVKRTVGPSITMEVMLDESVWPVRCDQNQLENTLLNLIINARDAMPNGGHLCIETRNHVVSSMEPLKFSPSIPGDYLFLCVKDNGIGMSPSVVTRAFDPFFTTKPLGQGTGLGLSMVYGFVTQSDGHIYIDSEVDRGTSICIYLPRFHGEVDSGVVDEHATPYFASGKNANILLVDDEDSLRQTLAEMLATLGYSVTQCSNGSDAIRAFQRSGYFDLLITDVGLPGGVNGRQLADAARHIQNGLQVLFITGYAESAAIRAGDLAEGMQVLAKPFSLEEFTNRVAATLKTENSGVS